MKNRNTIFRTIMLALSFLALYPMAQAVVPAPDGGYPGNNTAEGQNALLSLNVNTGTNNTAVGWFSLRSNVEGQFNTAVGAGTLFHNTACRNTAIGGAAMFSNTGGSFNTAVGMLSLFTNSTGGSNTAIGDGALFANNGSNNTATGARALINNITGSNNTATGAYALRNNTTGGLNTANGVATLLSNTEGRGNTAVGNSALASNTTGSDNTAVGAAALLNNTSGSDNIALGDDAGFFVNTANDVIAIGANGNNVSNSCYIGNIWQRPGGSQAVYVNSDGKLGAQVSSARFKDEIKPMDQASEIIYGLKPVSFRYKPEIEATRPVGFGLIAEEVEKINPNLVTRDKDGKPLSVRYDQVNAMLLNEFLKEHRKVQKLEATVGQQRRDFDAAVAGQRQEIEILTAQLKEQAAQIQKVSAQVQATKFATGRIRCGGSAHPLASNDY